ncbi:MAG: YesL family protein [Wujia sp.]
MKIFDVDGPIYKLMSSLTDVFVLSICWLIGSIPIVTIGVSTVALFDVTLRMVDNEEGYVGKQFFKAYKANLKQGFILGLITILCAYVIYLDVQFLGAKSQGSFVLMVMTIVTIFVFVCSLLYAYPLAARYENTIRQILRNSFRISMKYNVKTLLLIVVLVIEIAAFLWNMTTVILGILIGPACLAYTISSISKPIFKMIEKDNKSEEA